MSALFPDTHPKMEALQIELWRSASPTRKMTNTGAAQPIGTLARIGRVTFSVS